MKKVWVVIANEYGTNISSIVHICETKEIAESFRNYEHQIDYAGPVYKIKEMIVESELANIPEDVW
jgi:hypothetical protein